MGSDYPFPLGEWRPGEMIVTHQSLSVRAREKLLYANALEFLGLPQDFVKDVIELKGSVAAAAA